MFRDDEKQIGRHRLSPDHIKRPDEFYLLQRYLRRFGDQAHLKEAMDMQGGSIITPSYRGYESWEEMEKYFPEVKLPYPIVQWEFSPTWGCPEDCGGCPDRASLHVGDPPEVQADFETWKQRVDFAVQQGAMYILLIGGTIDRMSVARKMMRYILDDTPADAGWFTDGIMLTDWKTRISNVLLGKWIDEAGILKATTHVSADYLNLSDATSQLPDPRVRWDNSRWFKSAFGLNLLNELVARNARRVVVNTTISSQNIDEIIPLYEYVARISDRARGPNTNTVVQWTFAPWQSYIHLLYGDDPQNYDPHTNLNDTHREKLADIAEHIIADSRRRLAIGKSRVAANSSGYIAELPEKGLLQSQTFGGRMPGVGAFAPDGTFMPDPMARCANELKYVKLFHSSYGYTDRVPAGEGNVWTTLQSVNDGYGFTNLIQSTKSNSRHPWH